MDPRTLALLPLLLASPALAQTYAQPDLIRGLCEKTGCDEFRLISAEPAGSVPDGRLIRTRVQTFRASHAGRQGGSESNGYAFCSPTRPAIMAERNGQTKAYLIAPEWTAQPYEQRKQTNLIALYFTICHGPEAGRAAVRDLRGTAQGLGYRVARLKPETVDLKRADEIMGPKPAPRPPAVDLPPPIPPQPIARPTVPDEDDDILD